MVTDDERTLVEPYWDNEIQQVVLVSRNPIHGDIEYTTNLGLQDAQELSNKIGLIVEEQTSN
jgi:hypothetical protein